MNAENLSRINPYQLSLRAIGLLAVYKELGKYVPADELRRYVKEGRDAIRNSTKELVDAGLLTERRIRVKGLFRTEYHIAGLPFGTNHSEVGLTGPGNSEVGFSGNLQDEQSKAKDTSITSTKDTLLNNNSYTTDDTKLRLVKKEKEVIKDLPREEIAPGVYIHRWGIDPIGDPGHRINKEEEYWSTQDLAAEFCSIAYEKELVQGKIPGDEIGKIINKLVKDGMTRYQILGLIRKFFIVGTSKGQKHPRSLWASFMGYAYRFQNTVEKAPPGPTMTPECIAHQQKMMRLLKGEPHP